MARYSYRDERKTAEFADIIAGAAWGAIKTWQRHEGRPQTSAETVREAADDHLRSVDGADYDDGGAFVDAGISTVLAALNRSEAAIYLDE